MEGLIFGILRIFFKKLTYVKMTEYVSDLGDF